MTIPGIEYQLSLGLPIGYFSFEHSKHCTTNKQTNKNKEE